MTVLYYMCKILDCAMHIMHIHVKKKWDGEILEIQVKFCNNADFLKDHLKDVSLFLHVWNWIVLATDYGLVFL